MSLAADSLGNEFELRPQSCPTCGTTEKRELGLRGGPYQRYGLGIVTRIVQCKRCSLIFPDPFPFPRNPQALYGDPDKYFAHCDSAATIGFCRELAREVARRLGTRRHRLLDVGSGRGEMVLAAKLEGADAVGLEFAEAMIKRAAELYGVELRNESIESFAESNGGIFDAVVLNAVIEHVYDPDSMIAAAARLTRSGGVLYIDVPCEPNLLVYIGNALSRVRGSKQVYNLTPTWPPYHVFGFNRRALAVLLDKHGFFIEDVRVVGGTNLPSRQDWKDRTRAFVARQILRVANLTGTAHNMYVWARRR